MSQKLPKVLTEARIREVAERFGTPTYVYSQSALEQQADKALAFPNAFGLTVRYAMKANPNQNILRILSGRGIHIDASSEYEVERAIRAGISPENILLTSQQPSSDLQRLVERGAHYNVCSLWQLAQFGKYFPGNEVSVRINPGLGSGGTTKTNTGGPASSFGIWHENLNEVFKMAEEKSIKVSRIHTHIGSGSDPAVWQRVAGMSLGIVRKFLERGHDVRTLNLGGGYKVGRMHYESSTDFQECGEPVKQAFETFRKETGVGLHLEIEPGTALVANAGVVIARVTDLKRTPNFNFILTDTGMTEITRPALYGAQHPITVVPNDKTHRSTGNYIVSGHCCESGDILTPKDGNPDELQPRRLLEPARGDLIVIGGTGAYCSSMSTQGYNSYPQAAEVLITKDGKSKLIRSRQSLTQMITNEINVLH